jgi:plastocyanin
MKWYRVIILATIAFLLVGIIWIGVSRPSLAQAAGNTLTIHILGATNPPGFSPSLLSVHVNDTVVFLNDATPATTYSVVADDQSFASPPIAPGQQWTITFSQPGAHEYHVPAYASQMVGLLLVVASSVPLAPSPIPGGVETQIAQDKAQAAKTAQSSTAPASSLPLGLIVGGLGGLVLLLGIVMFFVLRSRQHQKAAALVPREPQPPTQ